MAYVHEGPALWLAVDRKTVVPDGDPRAAFLLVAPGGQVSDEDVAKYGLKAKKEAPDNKVKADPPANKSGLTIERDTSDKTIKLGKG